MARPRIPATLQAASMGGVSGNRVAETLTGSGTSVHTPGRRAPANAERNSLVAAWQHEAYRHVNICGEARYAVSLFANIAGRAEIGVSDAPQARVNSASWATIGPEVEALAEVAPTVRDRSRLIRSFMTHWVIAGDMYLIARARQSNDAGYVPPPEVDGRKFDDWDAYLRHMRGTFDPLTDDADDAPSNPNAENPIWEIVSVLEIQKLGHRWRVRYDNGEMLDLGADDPVIRIWNPDPENRREAWSPFRSMLPTLREIEWLTRHIFTQVRSRLISAGVWFLPENLTYPEPPAQAVGGEENLAAMNEAEKLMVSLAVSGTELLDDDETSFPTVVMADAAALEQIDQAKLIKFWSEIDNAAMEIRSDGIRRFALGMDLPPEQVLGSSGLAVTGAGGSAGSVNHWGVWANEEQTISAHVEPALDALVGVLTEFLRVTVDGGTEKVCAYDTTSLRMRQDRSKESIELYDRGILSPKAVARENSFDETDLMDEGEFKRWLLTRVAGGSATPEQVHEALRNLGVILATPVSGNRDEGETAPGQPGRNEPRNLDDHTYEGPPREDHEHKPAPFNGMTVVNGAKK